MTAPTRDRVRETREAIVAAVTRYAMRLYQPECAGDGPDVLEALDAYRDALLDALDADVVGMALCVVNDDPNHDGADSGCEYCADLATITRIRAAIAKRKETR